MDPGGFNGPHLARRPRERATTTYPKGVFVPRAVPDILGRECLLILRAFHSVDSTTIPASPKRAPSPHQTVYRGVLKGQLARRARQRDILPELTEAGGARYQLLMLSIYYRSAQKGAMHPPMWDPKKRPPCRYASHPENVMTAVLSRRRLSSEQSDISDNGVTMTNAHVLRVPRCPYM